MTSFTAFITFVVPLLVVVSLEVEGQDGRYAAPLSRLMSTRNSMAQKMKSIANNVEQVKDLKMFVQSLEEIKTKAKEFIDSSLTIQEDRNAMVMLKGVISQDRSFLDEEALYKSYSLKKNKNIRLGKLWEKMSIQINQLLSSGDQTFVVPFPTICQDIPQSALYSVTNDNTKEITIRDVCTGLSSCATESKPYYYRKFSNGTTNANRRMFGRRYHWAAQMASNRPKPRPKSKPKPVPRPKPNATPIQGGKGIRNRYLWIKGSPGTSSAPKPPKPKPKPKPKPTVNPMFEQDVRSACTSDSKCNVHKALPMMTGIFWHKISEMIVQKLCPQRSDRQSSVEFYQNVVEETDLLISYAITLPSYWKSTWHPFFMEAVSRQAFVELDEALSMVEAKKKDFEPVANVCFFFTEFADKACPLSDLYNQYILIKKTQRQIFQTRNIKDLRLYSKIDHKELLKLQNDDWKHLELLGSIKKLDDNLQASVSGISKYFKTLAKFDEGIAAADIGFLKGELEKYETSLTATKTKLIDDIREAMSLMAAVLTANLAEKIAHLAVLVATNANPLKLIFSGPDVKDIAEQAGQIAEASSQLVKGTALLISLNALAQDAQELGNAFIGNKNQISSLQKVVAKIRSGQAYNIGEDADLFIKQYGAYTPQTDRSHLAKNDALWSAFKDATCDLLNGEVGVAGAVPKSVAGGKLLCERLDGTLAQFATLREDTFDFQFQLVDAIAAIVRANIAKRLAGNIKGTHETLPASKLMTGFFIIHSKIQTVSSLYCDRLEYQHLGKPVDACTTTDGLFRKRNIDALITFKDNTPYDKVEKDAYIPTRSSSEGDTSFIDLPALARGETVIFKIPADKKWLREHQWDIPGKDVVPFVESFKIFLPQREYRTGALKGHTTTLVNITSVSGSSVSTSNRDVVYILPRGHSKYRTMYMEGYRSCPKEIDNPYSLCNNLPKICDLSTRSLHSDSLLPTVVSIWRIRQSVSQGSREVAWDAPSPGTNLLLTARVILKVPFMGSKRSKIPVMGLPRSDVIKSNDGCCSSNRYRTSLYNSECAVCPTKTTASLGGLYCQIDEAKSSNQAPKIGKEE